MDKGTSAAPTRLSPEVEPLTGLDGSATSIPSAAIEQFCTDVQRPLEGIVKKFCEDAYETILGDVQFYLIENAVFNIGSRFDAQQREVVTAFKALRAVEEALTVEEARANAHAARMGYWSEDRATACRAQAIEARRAETLGSVHESAVPEGNASNPEPQP